MQDTMIKRKTRVTVLNPKGQRAITSPTDPNGGT